MFLDAIHRLYSYLSDVNKQLMAHAYEVSDEDFASVVIEGQPSIRDTLVHMFSVIQLNTYWWGGELTGEEAFALDYRSDNYPDFDSVDNLHKKAEAEVSAFVSPLNTDGDLERIYQRQATPDELRTKVLWEVMLHVINHGTQHRSEVAMMLTKLGHSPGDMEIL